LLSQKLKGSGSSVFSQIRSILTFYIKIAVQQYHQFAEEPMDIYPPWREQGTLPNGAYSFIEKQIGTFLAKLSKP